MEIDPTVFPFLVLRLFDGQIVAATDTLESARNIVEMMKHEASGVAIYEAREPNTLKRFRLGNIEVTYGST